jgi:hypothetical protein
VCGKGAFNPQARTSFKFNEPSLFETSRFWQLDFLQEEDISLGGSVVEDGF